MPVVMRAKNGQRIAVPMAIMRDWVFKAVVDTDTEPVSEYFQHERAKDGAPIRGVTFKDLGIVENHTIRDVTDEDLDSEAFPYHILTLGYITTKTFKKKYGETFSHREVLDALLELEKEARVKSRDVANVYFDGLGLRRRHGLRYVPTWNNYPSLHNAVRILPSIKTRSGNIIRLRGKRW